MQYVIVLQIMIHVHVWRLFFSKGKPIKRDLCAPLYHVTQKQIEVIII